jgi:hypothetical protein
MPLLRTLLDLVPAVEGPGHLLEVQQVLHPVAT